MNWDESSQVKEKKMKKKVEVDKKPWQTETEIQTWNGKDSQQQ